MINLRARVIGFCFILVLCSCATQNSVPPSLPADTAFFKDSEHIYLTLRLENGKQLLFIVDTGGTATVLDKSLEPVLGKRLGTRKGNYPFFGKATLNVYDAPKLYLGNTQLLMDKRIFTDDLSQFQDEQPIVGIIGMDCLRHYCIQLDFADHKIRFLDPDHSESENLGEKFPLTYNFSDGIPSIRANFFGKSTARWEIDTGFTVDIAPRPKPLRELQEQTSGQLIFSKQKKNSTNGFVYGTFYLCPQIIFNNEACTNFIWSDSRGENLIGLRFLSRYLTTLNFPKRMMLLQHSNAESLADKDSVTNFLGNALAQTLYTFAPAAINFLTNLKEADQLPGWLKNEPGEIHISCQPKGDNLEDYPVSQTFIATKKGDVSQYHYIVVQPSKNSTLKLQRAWRTDAKGRVVEEYHVP
ncbi:MAG: hypothetical protein ACLPYZ_14300 [Limisphaerales bacterium]